ncbi:MAG: hypothetical protein K8F30_00750 [Taibaiella sp.]|nr:hypothetical protein [Taibaiella sp.]
MAETVLGISPATKRMGLGLIRNGKLVDWEIQSFPGKWARGKLERIVGFVSRYIVTNDVTAIAVKIPNELPVSANYIQLVGTLNRLFEKKGIRPMYYTLSELKKHHCPPGRATKETLAACVAGKYPNLFAEHEKEQVNRNRYYDQMFEAVAAARMYFETL